jgi:CubicO group peptidase (beta-lactamase class C family)
MGRGFAEPKAESYAQELVGHKTMHAKLTRLIVMLTPLALIAAAIALRGRHCCAGKAQPVFPGETWELATPGEAAFHPGRLVRFAASLGGSGCVVRGGRLVAAWGAYDQRLDVASAAKPVYAHLVYKAVEDGRIDGLDAPVHVHVDGLDDLNPEIGFKDREITWRHLVTQSACYGVGEQPGDAFDYSDYQTALLIDALTLNVYGVGFDRADETLLYPFLASPIGCEDSPTLNSPRSHPGRLRISARDFARVGWLYRNSGHWRGKRVMPAAFAEQALNTPHPHTLPRTAQQPAERLPGQRSIGGSENQERHLGSYSYMWWLNRPMPDGKLLLPDAPPDAFCSIGHAGGDVLLVIPSLDLVACWIDGLPGRTAHRFSKRGRLHVNKSIAALIDAMDADALARETGCACVRDA